jgi:opacity protein-like surface antigen
MAKIMMIIPTTDIRAYSSFGAAEVRRSDGISNHWRASPTFGLGINYNITERIMAELGGNYTAGWGESELSPAEDYYPFLYSVFLRLGVRVG